MKTKKTLSNSLSNTVVTYDIITKKPKFKAKKVTCNTDGTKCKPHAKLKDFGIPVMRPCGFPSSDTNRQKSVGRTSHHPLKLVKFPSKAKLKDTDKKA